MNTRIFTLAAVAATMMLGSMTMSAKAQDRVRTYIRDEDQRDRQELRIAPINRPVPQLGFEARMTGDGMLIESARYGSLAWDAGLERGDKIHKVNGRHIDSVQEYRQALVDAQEFNNGRVQLTVENVRWHTGESCHRWVTRTIYLPHVCNDGPSFGGSFGG